MIDLELVYHVITLTFVSVFNIVIWPALLIGIMVKFMKNLIKTDNV